MRLISISSQIAQTSTNFDTLCMVALVIRQCMRVCLQNEIFQKLASYLSCTMKIRPLYCTLTSDIKLNANRHQLGLYCVLALYVYTPMHNSLPRLGLTLQSVSQGYRTIFDDIYLTVSVWLERIIVWLTASESVEFYFFEFSKTILPALQTVSWSI